MRKPREPRGLDPARPMSIEREPKAWITSPPELNWFHWMVAFGMQASSRPRSLTIRSAFGMDCHAMRMVPVKSSLVSTGQVAVAPVGGRCRRFRRPSAWLRRPWCRSAFRPRLWRRCFCRAVVWCGSWCGSGSGLRRSSSCPLLCVALRMIAPRMVGFQSLPTHGVTSLVMSTISPSSSSAAMPMTKMQAMVSEVFSSVPDR